jgi:hypothetical protein
MIAVSRTQNALRFLENAQVQKTDVDELLEYLQCKGGKKKSKAVSSGAVLHNISATVTTTAAAAADEACDVEVVEPHFKRSKRSDDAIAEERQGCIATVPVASVADVNVLKWSQALKQLHAGLSEHGHNPCDYSYLCPVYVPLLNRKKEGTYAEKTNQLTGKKKVCDVAIDD